MVVNSCAEPFPNVIGIFELFGTPLLGISATVKIFLVLVHNKMDLDEPRQIVKKSQGEQKAKDLKIAFHCTSVMRDQGVNEVFKRLAKCNLERILSARNASATSVHSRHRELADTVFLADEKKFKKRKSLFSKCRILD